MVKVISFACLILAGCVLSERPRNSRYSVDISKMQKADYNEDTWVYRHPTKRVTDYKHFIISPIRVYEQTGKKLGKEERAHFDILAEDWRDRVVQLMEKDYSVTTKRGPDTLEIALSVQDIKPIVTLKKPDGNIAVVTDTTLKGTKLEIDCYDSKSLESIFQLSTLFKGLEYAAYEQPSLTPNIEKAFDDWLAYFKIRFDEAMAKKGQN